MFDLSLVAGQWSEWVATLPGFGYELTMSAATLLDYELADGSTGQFTCCDQGFPNFRGRPIRFRSGEDTKLLVTFLVPAGADSVRVYPLDPTGAWTEWVRLPYRSHWRTSCYGPSGYLEYDFQGGSHYRVHESEGRVFRTEETTNVVRFRSAQGGTLTLLLSEHGFPEAGSVEPAISPSAPEPSDPPVDKPAKAGAEPASLICTLSCVGLFFLAGLIWAGVVILKGNQELQQEARKLREFVAQTQVHARLLDDPQYFETRAFQTRDAIMRDQERGENADMYFARSRRKEIGDQLGRWEGHRSWKRLVACVPEAVRAMHILKAEIRLYDRVGEITDAQVALWREHQARMFEAEVSKPQQRPLTES